MVRDFVDVFLDEVPKLLPAREVEFTIDLVPGILPITMARYEMAPLKLRELKT